VRGFVVVMVFIALYFVPSIIAAYREHRDRLAILMLNILLGWTAVGWIAALVWACTANTVPVPSAGAR
jgi:hypothetical protein